MNEITSKTPGLVASQLKKEGTPTNEVMNINAVKNLNTFIDMERLQFYREQENKAWYSDDSFQIEEFYKKYSKEFVIPMMNKNNFWTEVTKDIPRVHVPVAGMITEIMSSLLFGRSVQIKTDEYTQEELDVLLESNDFKSLMQNASQYESYSGTVGFKYVIDTDISEYPIIEIYPAENIELKTKYGRVYEIVFIDYKQKSTDLYTLKTRCGKGYVKYELYNSLGQRISLSQLDDTKGLQDYEIVDRSGKKINKILANYKVNRVANNQFPDSAKGSSDYSGLIDEFMFIDETESAKADIIQKSRTMLFANESQATLDAEGKPIEYNKYGVNIMWFKGIDEDKALPKRDSINVNIVPHNEALDNSLKIIANRIRVSLSTLGFDNSGANASAEALNIRDQETRETFASKSQLYSEFLPKVAEMLLVYNNLKYIGNNKYRTSYEDKEFSVIFPPYRETTISEKFNQFKELLDYGVTSREYVINELYKDDLTEDELDKLKKELLDEKEEISEDINENDNTNTMDESDVDNIEEEPIED